MTRLSTFRAIAPALSALAILAATVPASAPAAAKSNFDGQWSVLIVTQKGQCDRAYRYPVKIENGSVGYAGSASFTVTVVDTVPPAVAIVSPSEGGFLNTPVATVVATVADTGSGVAAVLADGVPMSSSGGGTYTAQVPLTEGADTIAVAASAM